MITFAVQGVARDASSWLEFARRADREGYARLYCPDHPGSCPSPVPALAAAAAVTDRVRLGALVLNAGVHEPFDLAVDTATLDLLSGGRALLGIGAGHTPTEWEQVGRPYPTPAQRVEHYLRVVDAVRALLAGDALSGVPHGDIPLLMGGNNTRLLRHAARTADVISLGGMGKTLADGHRHEVRWAPEQIDERLALIRDATPAGRAPQLEALVQHVELTDDAEAAAAALFADDPDAPTPAHIVESPYVLIGTAHEIADRLTRTAAERGITAYAVRAPAMDTVARIRELLPQ